MKQTLDLINNNWKESKEWNLVGIPIITRPYKRMVLVVAACVASLSLILPDLGLGLFGAIKLLNKWG